MHFSTGVFGGIGLIRIDGAVDTTTAPELGEAAERMLSTRARSLVIDCHDIDFIDSAGLHMIARAQGRARARGGRVTIRCPSAVTLRLLKVSGLDAVVFVDGLSGAGTDARLCG
jgi:anti-sigma B factor antagonist